MEGQMDDKLHESLFSKLERNGMIFTQPAYDLYLPLRSSFDYLGTRSTPDIGGR